MPLFFLLLFFLFFGVGGCTSVNNYIKTRKSEYLYSQDLGPLKLPKELKATKENYAIPMQTAPKPTQLPDLYPPTD